MAVFYGATHYQSFAVLFTTLVNLFGLGILGHIIATLYRQTSKSELQREYTSEQTWWRLAAYTCCIGTNISNTINVARLFTWPIQDANIPGTESFKVMHLASLFAVLFFAFTYVFYMYIMVYRYKRLFLIIPASRQDVLMNRALFLFLMVVLVYVLMAIVFNAMRVTLSILPTWFLTLQTVYLYMAMAISIVVVSTELCVNYRLVSTALRPSNTPSDIISIDQAQKQLQLGRKITRKGSKFSLASSRLQKRLSLKHEMLLYMILFILSDICVILLFVLGNGKTLPRFETQAVCTSWILLHIYIEFRFLDFFLFKLKAVKHDRMNGKNSQGTTDQGYFSRTDIVQEGLIASISLGEQLSQGQDGLTALVTFNK